MLGVFLAIIAAVSFAINMLTVKRGVMRLGLLHGMAIMLVFGTITTLLAAIVFEGSAAIVRATGLGLLYFAAGGIIHFLGGWGFLNLSARLIGSARLSAMTSLTPVFAGLFALVALQESLNIFSSIGLMFFVGGLYLTTTSKSS
jgi:drug/metabolite transporter (DMT)-like permease